MRFPSARFGNRCDIRSGFNLLMSPGARLEVGTHCVLDRDMTIECTGALRIGHRTIFGHHCTLAARDSLTIGDDCLIAEMVSIRDHDHCFDRLDIPVREQGCVGTDNHRAQRVDWSQGHSHKRHFHWRQRHVGANAVVTKDIPANAIAVGIPARVIRTRQADEYSLQVAKVSEQLRKCNYRMATITECIRADIARLVKGRPSRLKSLGLVLTNRGLQSIVLYRLSHLLWKRRVPLLPLILTRLAQHLFAVDISYRADLGPGM
jgi:serine acetyltransferase